MNTKNLISVLVCAIAMLMISACEKSEIQNSKTLSTLEIKDRSCPIDDCDDCDPIDDCCCSVQLLSDHQDVELEFCGTSGPCLSTEACEDEDPGTCPDIFGFIETISLPMQNSTALFCVPKSSTFAIKSANAAATVRITCQAGQTNPTYVTMQLLTPPNKPYWQTNGSCDLTACF